LLRLPPDFRFLITRVIYFPDDDAACYFRRLPRYDATRHATLPSMTLSSRLMLSTAIFSLISLCHDISLFFTPC